MKVTRDVIYDLLPSYFAGDASQDTRALVEAYFETDPEFARMASRFQSLIADRQASSGAADAATEVRARERETFQCARTAAELPQKARASALGFGFASLFSFGVALLTWRPPMNAFYNPGVLLGVIFLVTAVVVFALSFRVRPDSWWRGLAGLDDETLKSVGFRSRR
jgi:anti-sigma factor RsiW